MTLFDQKNTLSFKQLENSCLNIKIEVVVVWLMQVTQITEK